MGRSLTERSPGGLIIPGSSRRSRRCQKAAMTHSYKFLEWEGRPNPADVASGFLQRWLGDPKALYLHSNHYQSWNEIA